MDLLAALVESLDALRSEQPRVLVAIDGPDAAGKTTLADALATRLSSGVVRASIDDFDQPVDMRHRGDVLTGDSYYRDAFDHDSFRTRLLEPFAAGESRVLTQLRHPLTADLNEVYADVPQRAVLVADGVFLQRPELRHLWTFVVYVTVEPAVSLERARVRDLAWSSSVADIDEGYLKRYLPGQTLYRDEVNPAARANVVIDNTDPTHPEILRFVKRQP